MKAKILIVDDESDILLLFEQRFREEIRIHQLQFYYAESGEKAIELLKKQETRTHLVLILSDINMPGIRGLELLKIIKQNYPELVVFMVTAYGNAENSQLAWDYGAEEIIHKPINFDYLKNLIMDVIHLYKLREKTDSDNDKNPCGR